MENAHLRMGRLKFVKQSRDTTTEVSVHLDRLIAQQRESAQGRTVRAHLVSVFGGDVELGAVAAAITEGACFEVQGPGVSPKTISLGEKATVLRGSITLPGRKRPVRHLVAVSEELAQTLPGQGNTARHTILIDQSPQFMLYRLSVRFGLPALPEWSEWFVEQLRVRKRIETLVGVGCSPVIVKGSKRQLLAILSRGLRSGALRIPDETQQIHWDLRKRMFLPSSA